MNSLTLAWFTSTLLYKLLSATKLRKKVDQWRFLLTSTFFLAHWHLISSHLSGNLRSKMTEVVVRSCSVKKVFLEISQNSGENASARASFLIKLQASQVFSCVATSELQIYLAFHRRYVHISFVQNQNRCFFLSRCTSQCTTSSITWPEKVSKFYL